MDYDQEIAEKYSKDLERLQNAEPEKQTPMIMGWLKDKRENKGELAVWLLAKCGRGVQAAMSDLALNRRNSDWVRVRALRVMREIGPQLRPDEISQFCVEASLAKGPVGSEMAAMLRAIPAS